MPGRVQLRSLPHRRSKAALRGASKVDHKRTIFIALVGNVVIAIAKLVAGLMTGSAAMLSEAAHSFADSINEVFLGISLGRSQRPADSDHPFGFGRERFLWAFVAAIASFTIGGCVSIGLALRQFSVGKPNGHQAAAWIVLAVAFVADGISFLQGIDEARGPARERELSVWRYLRVSSDPILRAIVVEDSAAIIGTLLAALGLLLSSISGSHLYDSIASLLIGLLLALTALGLAQPLADFLIGRSLPEVFLKQIYEIMEDSPGIREVIGLQAVYTGPEEAIVAAKIRASCSTVDELAKEMDALDHRIREAIPFVADVFVDVTTWDGKSDPTRTP